MRIQDWIYTSEDPQTNWFYEKYYASGSNSRYMTFQLALNLLLQRTYPEGRPLILETGCQRQADDLGAGMSSSIFAEFLFRLGKGKLRSVDNNGYHLTVCASCVAPWISRVELACDDSIHYLTQHDEPVDLLYLDSLDYPVGGDEGNITMQEAAQQHNLAEFKAIEDRLPEECVVLLDDNNLSGGGKPKLLKEYLFRKRWKCLLDYQQSLWVKKV